jgi:hypothetical protein
VRIGQQLGPVVPRVPSEQGEEEEEDEEADDEEGELLFWDVGGLFWWVKIFGLRFW